MTAAAAGKLERFMSKVDQGGSGGCWLWRGQLRGGYGVFHIGVGRGASPEGAHRAALMLLRGVELPAGHSIQVDHLCRVRSCVNPDHLEVVTAAENTRRGLVAAHGPNGKTTCIHGHRFEGDNLYIGPDKKRGCRACHVARQRRYVQRKAERTAVTQ